MNGKSTIELIGNIFQHAIDLRNWAQNMDSIFWLKVLFDKSCHSSIETRNSITSNERTSNWDSILSCAVCRHGLSTLMLLLWIMNEKSWAVPAVKMKNDHFLLKKNLMTQTIHKNQNHFLAKKYYCI